MLRRLLFGDDSPFEPTSIVVLCVRAPLKCLVYFAYHFLNALRSNPQPAKPSVRVVCISDTHAQTQPIPAGDILIHAGDLGTVGTVSEIQAQIDWIASLPHPYKVVVAGNHDTYLDPRSRRTLPEPERNRELQWKGIHYLQHTSLLVRFPQREYRGRHPPPPRTLKIYGAPQIPECGGPEFAFQYARGRDAWTDTIPWDVDVLVTHTPPKFHLDLPLPDGMGCEHLTKEAWRLRHTLHVFGHVHVGAGREVNWWHDGQKAYERALARPVSGLTRGLLSVPAWIDLALVLFWGVRGVIWDRVWGGEERGTVLVNAGLMAQAPLSHSLPNSAKLAPQHLPLRIVVHGASKIHTYGDTVSGVVEVDTSSRTPHVTIRFVAKVTTQVYVPNGSRDKAKVYLFCHALELYSGLNISSLAPVEGGFVSLPFSFTFPSEVQMAPSASGFQSFKESSVFEHLPGHPLPPTIYAEGRSGLPQTVEYFLEARMTNTSHSFFYLGGAKKVRHSLAFSPPCIDLSWASPPLEQNIVTLTRHSRWLYDDSPDEYHGFCSRMRDLISCSSDPTATFTVTTTVPTIARAGYPLPVTVRLAHIDRTDSLSRPPPVRLRAFRVTLKATTDFCVHKTQPNNKTHKSIDLMYQRYDTDTMILSPPLLPDGSELALAELCVRERTGPANDVPPTFKTYGLARSYAAKVVLWIECAGKTWELEAARFPIEVRPWLGIEAEEVPQMNGQGTEDVPPPPYEEVAPPYGS